MNPQALEQIVQAVLYEGYILYPYRPSSKKNCRERFTFGRVYPEAYSRAQHGREPCLMQTECLVEAQEPTARLQVRVKFLQPLARGMEALCGGKSTGGKEPCFEPVPGMQVDEEYLQSWHEAVEREVRVLGSFELPVCVGGRAEVEPSRRDFSFPAASSPELVRDRKGELVGRVVRRTAALDGSVEVAVSTLGERLFKVSVRIVNQTPMSQEQLEDSEAVLMRTMASTHTISEVTNGAFISLLAPGNEYVQAAAGCRNIGTWPVLVGEEAKQERDMLLSSPIILYDYPKIAPESPGPSFDGTEIDEILSLRILTMTDQEKLEMRRVDEQARRLLERTEGMGPERLLRLHGTLRKPQEQKDNGDEPSPPRGVEFDDFFGASTPLQGVTVNGVYLQAGDRVRIRPKSRADVMDLALAGQTAVIEAVEQDMERCIHLAVVLENDPGKDLGLLRQPGHRFFYGVEEVEPLGKEVS